MWILLIYVLISFLVPLIIGLVRFLVRAKFIRVDSFECGFDSFNVRVFPVSLRFFIFCIIFLILDLELIIISVVPLVLWRRGFILNIVIFFIFGDFKYNNRMVIWKVKMNWINWGWVRENNFTLSAYFAETKLSFVSSHPQLYCIS